MDNQSNNRMSNEKRIEERKKYLIKKKVSLVRFIIQFLVTLVAWFILFYCFRDIITNIYNYLSGETTTLSFPEEIVRNFGIYGIISFLVISLWVFYNKMMFGGRDRRKKFPDPSDEEQANKYGITVEELVYMRDSKVLIVGFDDENKINYVDKG